MGRHVSPAALPELQAFLAGCQVRLGRPEGRKTLERSTTGLFTEWLTNTCDPMAQAVPGTRTPRVQEVLTTRQGDAEDLKRRRGQKGIAKATGGEEGLFRPNGAILLHLFEKHEHKARANHQDARKLSTS
jgi:hypothetical protein